MKLQTRSPTIFLVEEPTTLAPCLTKSLRGLGYRLLVRVDV
jgi:hypothetical protein